MNPQVQAWRPSDPPERPCRLPLLPGPARGLHPSAGEAVLPSAWTVGLDGGLDRGLGSGTTPDPLAASDPLARGGVGGRSRAADTLATLSGALGDPGELGAPVRGFW